MTAIEILKTKCGSINLSGITIRDEKIIIEAMEEYADQFRQNDVFRFEKVTRVEVISHREGDNIGRLLVHWKDDNKVEGHLQDNGRTLKIFIDKRH